MSDETKCQNCGHDVLAHAQGFCVVEDVQGDECSCPGNFTDNGMMEAANYYKRALDVAVAENERLKRELAIAVDQRDAARANRRAADNECAATMRDFGTVMAERDRYRTALETIGQRSLTFKHLGEPHCDTCLRPMKDCDGAVAADRCPGRIARRALTSTTPPPAECRACGNPLLPENHRVADGCPCNSSRGVNHGLVAKETCTCEECDPAQTGATRYPLAAEPLGTTPWRVGRKVGRTLYDKNDRLCGVVDTPDIASLVVDAVNGFYGKNVEPPVIVSSAAPTLTEQAARNSSYVAAALDRLNSLAGGPCLWCHGLKRIVRDYQEERGIIAYTYDCPRCVQSAAAAPPVALRPEPVNLLARLMKFTEHVSDVLNEMDAVEDEDLEVEGGILAEVRAFLAAAQPRGEKL